MVLDQVAGDEGAEAAGGAGDQHGALGVDRRRRPPRPSRLRRRGRRGRQRRALAQGELGLLGPERERGGAGPSGRPRCRRCRSGRSGRGARTGPSGRGPRPPPRRGRETRRPPSATAPSVSRARRELGLGLGGEPLLDRLERAPGQPCGRPRQVAGIAVDLAVAASSTSGGAASSSARGILGPLESEQTDRRFGPAALQLRRDRAGGAASSRDRGHAGRRRNPRSASETAPRLLGRDPHPQLARSRRLQGDPAPGEGQPQLASLPAPPPARCRAGPRRAAPGGCRSARPPGPAPRAGRPRRRSPRPRARRRSGPGRRGRSRGRARRGGHRGTRPRAARRPRGARRCSRLGGRHGASAARAPRGVAGPTPPPRPRGGSGSRSRAGRPRLGRRPRPGWRPPAARAGRSGACRVSSSTLCAPTCSAGPQRQLDEGGAGQEDGAGDGVVGQPGVGRQGEAAGEGEARPRSGSSIAAPSSGCSAVAWPAAARSPAPLGRSRASSACAGRGRWAAGLAWRRCPRRRRPSRASPRRRGRRRAQRSGRSASGRPSRRVGTKVGLLVFVGEALARHRAEHRVGAELEEGGGALLGEGRDRVGEAHRLAHVGDPVGGVGGLLGVEQLAGDVGDDRDLGLAEAERVSATSANSSSIGSIRGEWKAWETARRLVFLPWLSHWRAERFDRFLAPEITVEVGPLIAAIASSASLPAIDSATSSSVASIASHRPALGQGAHQACPWRRPAWPRRAGREDAGDVGGGDLADRVAGEQVGLEARRSPERDRAPPRSRRGPAGRRSVSSSSSAAFVPSAKTSSLSGVARWGSSSAQTSSKASAKGGYAS